MTDSERKSLETRLSVLETVVTSLSEDVKELRDTNKWLTRLIIGALILAVLAYALKGGFSLPV